MSTIPTTNATTFWGAQTIFTWSGATYKAISDATLKYGNKIKEEATTGTDLPYYGTGVYHGELDLKVIGSSDNSMWNAAAATSGIVPTMGLTMKPQDTQSALSGQTWTFSGKVQEFTQKWSKDNYVEYDVKMILATKPVVSS